MVTELLDTLLAHVRVASSVFGRLELGEPWGGRVAASDRVLVHLVVEGAMWLDCDGTELVAAEGDVVVLPRGTEHAVAHARGAPLWESETWPTPAEGELGIRRVLGGDGPRTVLLCAALTLERTGRKGALGALPSVVHVPAAATTAVPGLPALLTLIRDEVRSAAPLSPALLARLGELLLLHALRGGLPRSAAARPGDARIARALAALYAQPARDWTVAALAKKAGMSRSSFAVAFREALGESPIQHLAAHRASIARRMLVEDRRASIAEIAGAVGYSSEAAFTVAFRRMTGLTPSAARAGTRT